MIGSVAEANNRKRHRTKQTLSGPRHLHKNVQEELRKCVWVTVGKTEHQARLLEEMGNDYTVLIRWESTGSEERVPMLSVRHDNYGVRNRRKRKLLNIGSKEEEEKEKKSIPEKNKRMESRRKRSKRESMKALTKEKQILLPKRKKSPKATEVPLHSKSTINPGKAVEVAKPRSTSGKAYSTRNRAASSELYIKLTAREVSEPLQKVDTLNDTAVIPDFDIKVAAAKASELFETSDVAPTVISEPVQTNDVLGTTAAISDLDITEAATQAPKVSGPVRTNEDMESTATAPGSEMKEPVPSVAGADSRKLIAHHKEQPLEKKVSLSPLAVLLNPSPKPTLLPSNGSTVVKQETTENISKEISTRVSKSQEPTIPPLREEEIKDKTKLPQQLKLNSKNPSESPLPVLTNASTPSETCAGEEEGSLDVVNESEKKSKTPKAGTAQEISIGVSKSQEPTIPPIGEEKIKDKTKLSQQSKSNSKNPSESPLPALTNASTPSETCADEEKGSLDVVNESEKKSKTPKAGTAQEHSSFNSSESQSSSFEEVENSSDDEAEWARSYRFERHSLEPARPATEFSPKVFLKSESKFVVEREERSARTLGSLSQRQKQMLVLGKAKPTFRLTKRTVPGSTTFMDDEWII
jgi:hypothetical protein